MRLHKQDGPSGLVYEHVPQPQPLAGEVLVRVYATGVTPEELGWGTTWKTREGIERRRPIPGHELAGMIVQIGPKVLDFKVGQAVYGLTAFDRDGSLAEYAIALPSELAPIPSSLDYVPAAAVPLAALTAWQALFDHAHLSAGQTLLVHRAAGAVGIFVVQLARWAKAHVIGVDAPRYQGLLRELGCEQVIDFTTTRFEDVVRNVDVVLDAVGLGDALDRSWQVIRKGGTLISLARQPSPKWAKAYDVRAVFFVVEPSRDELRQIGELIDTQQLRPVLGKVLPLSEARQAYEQKKRREMPGKIVLLVVGVPS
jgi:NADPH:quinone reductase-like Zn-dependent oxidoreductase